MALNVASLENIVVIYLLWIHIEYYLGHKSQSKGFPILSYVTQKD